MLGRRGFLQLAGAMAVAWSAPLRAQEPGEAAIRARTDWWSRVGTNDPDLVAYLVSPELQGAPAWPTTRQAFRVVRTPGTVIIASDGLSDPFDDGEPSIGGFGMEVFIETPDLNGAAFAGIRNSWAFTLIENFARNVANMGGIGDALQRYGVVSMELPAPEGMPREWLTPRGTVGALIDVPVPDRERGITHPALGAVRIVPLTLITPADTERVVADGARARQSLATHLATSGRNHLSSLRRQTTP